MNTWIWGVPKWKFLHSLSFSPSVHEYPAESSAFLETLEEVLPCIYCRESYKTFLPRLEGEFGMTLEQVVAEGQLPKWMFDLHECVNEKLDFQLAEDMMKKEGIDLGDRLHKVCRKRQITFECLIKRFKIRPVQFCPEDVWEFLQIFALNMDLTVAERTPQRRKAQLTFFMLMPLMATIAGADAGLVRQLELGARHVARSLDTSIFTLVTQMKASYNAHLPTLVDPATAMFQTYLEEQREIIDTARSGKNMCKHGSCQ
jgi:hypothetical protein